MCYAPDPPPATAALAFLVEATDRACAEGTPAAIVAALSSALQPRWAQMALLPRPSGGEQAYVRRELYRSPARGYQILLMGWPPGQRSGLHDHAGTWGLEAVVEGALVVRDFTHVDGSAADYTAVAAPGGDPDAATALMALAEGEVTLLQPGHCLALLPPVHVHDCANPSATEVVYSLHVYGMPLETIRRFDPVGKGQYLVSQVALAIQ